MQTKSTLDYFLRSNSWLDKIYINKKYLFSLFNSHYIIIFCSARTSTSEKSLQPSYLYYYDDNMFNTTILSGESLRSTQLEQQCVHHHITIKTILDHHLSLSYFHLFMRGLSIQISASKSFFLFFFLFMRWLYTHNSSSSLHVSIEYMMCYLYEVITMRRNMMRRYYDAESIT